MNNNDNLNEFVMMKCTKHEIIFNKNMFKSRIIELANEGGRGYKRNKNIIQTKVNKRKGTRTLMALSENILLTKILDILDQSREITPIVTLKLKIKRNYTKV